MGIRRKLGPPAYLLQHQSSVTPEQFERSAREAAEIEQGRAESLPGDITDWWELE